MSRHDLEVRINKIKSSIENWDAQLDNYITAKGKFNGLSSKLTLIINQLTDTSDDLAKNYQSSSGKTKCQSTVDEVLQNLNDKKNILSQSIIPEVNDKIDSIKTKIRELNRDLDRLQDEYDNYEETE